MLEMGFKEDVEFIMGTIKAAGPKEVQTLMFSATVPGWVQQIARSFLNQEYSFVDLVKDLKKKTAKQI